MQKKVMQVSFHFEVCILLLCQLIWYKAANENSDRVHGSPILSADFLGQLNHAHKSQLTLLIVWHFLNCNQLFLNSNNWKTGFATKNDTAHKIVASCWKKHKHVSGPKSQTSIYCDYNFPSIPWQKDQFCLIQ